MTWRLSSRIEALEIAARRILASSGMHRRARFSALTRLRY
jgi:hypothetical protein